MATGFLDGDDCLDEGVARVGRALVNVEDTEMLVEVGGRLADVEDVEMLEEITELDDLVASAGDAEVEPLIPASGLNRDPNAPS